MGCTGDCLGSLGAALALTLVLSNTQFGTGCPKRGRPVRRCLLRAAALSPRRPRACPAQRSRVAQAGSPIAGAIIVGIALFTLTRGTEGSVLIRLGYLGCGLLFLIRGWLMFRSSARLPAEVVEQRLESTVKQTYLSPQDWVDVG